VSVGPLHTARLKEMSLNNDPGNADEYSVCLIRFTHEHDAHKSIGTPRKLRHQGVWFYRFDVAGYSFDIKVDRQPTPSLIPPFLFATGETAPNHSYEV
jgi:hypothetical protein